MKIYIVELDDGNGSIDRRAICSTLEAARVSFEYWVKRWRYSVYLIEYGNSAGWFCHNERIDARIVTQCNVHSCPNLAEGKKYCKNHSLSTDKE